MSISYENLQQENELLISKLHQRDSENFSLKESINDLMTENNEKDSSIAKASKIIDILRNDLEKYHNDLKNSESVRLKLNKENKDFEKQINELKKEFNQLTALKKSEKRAKNEKIKLKEELNQTAQDYETKEIDFKKKYNEVLDDIKRYQLKIDSMQEKFKELHEKFLEKEKEFLLECENSKILQNLLDEKNLTIESISQENLNIQNCLQAQLSLVKREAENQIRVLQSNKDGCSLPKPKPIKNNETFDKFANKTLKKTIVKIENKENIHQKCEEINNTSDKISFSSDYYKEKIIETLEREAKLFEKFDKIFRKETEFISENIQNKIPNQLIGLRPEVECWRMKCEELEQKNNENLIKLSNMMVLIKDFEKMAAFAKKTANEEKKLQDNLIKELEIAIQFLEVEINEKNKGVLYEIYGKNNDFKSIFMNSQEKIENIKNKIENLNHEKTELKKSTGDFHNLLESLFNFFKEVESKMGISPIPSSKNVFLEDLIENPSKYINFQEIRTRLDEIWEIKERLNDLERENYQLKTEKNNEKFLFEKEKTEIVEQISFLQENLCEMAKKLDNCNETIQFLESKNAELQKNRNNGYDYRDLEEKIIRKKQKIFELKKLLKNNEENIGKIRRSVKKTEESIEKAEKPMKNSRNEGESMIFLKEIYSDLKEIISNYTCFLYKLDEGMLKSANYNTIQNKSETVTNVLSDNIKMSEEKFIKKSELLLSEYLERKKSFYSEKELFYRNLNALNYEKIQIEMISIRNAIRLLDISNIKDKNSDFYKRKSVDFNTRLSEIFEKNKILKKNAELFTFEMIDKDKIPDPENLFERIQLDIDINKEEKKYRGHLQIQIFEILRENTGFRIAANKLYYILQKYKDILEELS